VSLCVWALATLIGNVEEEANTESLVRDLEELRHRLRDYHFELERYLRETAPEEVDDSPF